MEGESYSLVLLDISVVPVMFIIKRFIYFLENHLRLENHPIPASSPELCVERQGNASTYSRIWQVRENAGDSLVERPMSQENESLNVKNVTLSLYIIIFLRKWDRFRLKRMHPKWVKRSHWMYAYVPVSILPHIVESKLDQLEPPPVPVQARRRNQERYC